MRRHRPHGSRWQLGAVGVCVIAGLLLGTARSYSHGKDIGSRSVDLATLVGNEQQRVDAAQAAATGLQSQINAAAGNDVSPQIAAARQRATALGAGAELISVHGPALRVSLDDAPRDAEGNYPAGVDPDDLVVHQQDVQAVVNAMWVGGAEAMTIMDQRVVNTSAVRCIGNTLLLQGRTYSPPFVITAIGDSAAMTKAMNAEPGIALYSQYVTKYHLGFEIQPLEDVTLPGYNGLIRMTAAQESK